MNHSAFEKRFQEWTQWRATADRSEDGWQTDFPQWDELMELTTAAMKEPGADAGTISMIAELWDASEETESLLEFARDNLDECWKVLRSLSSSSLPRCRWQVYEVLADAGSRAEPILRQGLFDSDPYARRRALLALARHRPSDAQQLAEAFLNDDDPYIRQAAIEMVLATQDTSFRRSVLALLSSDPVEHVRVNARAKLSAE